MRQFASCDTRLEHSWGLRDSSTRRKRARQHRREREDLARRPNTHQGPSTWPCLYTTPPSRVIRGSRSHMPPDHFSAVWRLVFADRESHVCWQGFRGAAWAGEAASGGRRLQLVDLRPSPSATSSRRQGDARAGTSLRQVDNPGIYSETRLERRRCVALAPRRGTSVREM